MRHHHRPSLKRLVHPPEAWFAVGLGTMLLDALTAVGARANFVINALANPGTIENVGVVALLVCTLATLKLTRAVVGASSPACAGRASKAAYRGKVVWVTGASSGIGRELSLQLAKLGARLVLSARRQDALEETKASAVAAGAEAAHIVVLPVDLEDTDSLAVASAKALAAFGGVDVLVNNGGFAQRETGAKTDFSVDRTMTAVNYLAPVGLTKAVLPSMVERGGGTLINISSLAGKFGAPLRTAYCGSKHALIGFMDALRAEEGARKSGVTVLNVCPGSVRTSVARNARTGDGSLRGCSDPNIEAGLDVSWVCERILVAAASGVEEVWIAKGKEMLFTYIAQYMPVTFKMLVPLLAKKVMKDTLAATADAAPAAATTAAPRRARRSDASKM